MSVVHVRSAIVVGANSASIFSRDLNLEAACRVPRPKRNAEELGASAWSMGLFGHGGPRGYGQEPKADKEGGVRGGQGEAGGRGGGDPAARPALARVSRAEAVGLMLWIGT